MARPQSITIAALNIKTHPHSPEQYVTLFKRAKDKKLLGKIRGSEFALIGWWQPIIDDPVKDGIYGEIYRFLNIDPDQPWLDLQNLEPLEINAEHPMPVPANLKPNLQLIDFAFFPKHHRLFFDTAVLKPNSALKAFNEMFLSTSITEEFGMVDIEVETSHEGIEKILQIPRKTKLMIDLTVPNPDDVSGLEEEVMTRLINSKVRREHVEQSTDHPDGIDPDPYTRALISLSRSNGRTTVIGYDDDNNRLEESTEKHPIFRKKTFNPNEENRQQAMIASSKELLSEILRQRNV